ncbi:MAG: GNAT family N-acetyltransferase [Thermoleophilia bacterium]|nr:GNAT family N-acetyltransferase [Thermoleophilia bacterium]
MADIEIRAPREEEFPALIRVSCLAFGEEPAPEDEEQYRRSFPFGRALSAYEGGNMVATSTVLTQELTLPGGRTLPMGGVTWIATLPTHRRRGILTRLMAAQSADMLARGDALSGLIASEGTIYRPFGYGPATHIMSFAVERPYASFASPVDDPGGISLLDDEEAAAELPALYDRLRLLQPGAVSRPADWWPHYLHDPAYEREGATKMYHALHRTADGTPDGYVSYRIKGAWSASSNPLNETQVVEVQAADPDVYKILWDYVLKTDLSHKTSCRQGRVDEPLRWLLKDPRRFEVTGLVDYLHLRLLDVPRALAAREYGAAGELVLEVGETFPAPKRAHYRLRAEAHSGAECDVTSREPDLELRIDYLAAAFLGGVSFTTLATAGRVMELTPGAVARADAVFATATAPFCSTMF